jgi:hypothetical protein
LISTTPATNPTSRAVEAAMCNAASKLMACYCSNNPVPTVYAFAPVGGRLPDNHPESAAKGRIPLVIYPL